MMIRRTPELTVSVFAAVLLAAPVTLADDSVAARRVQIAEHGLDAKEARAIQKAWADRLRLDVVAENSIGMQLCVIPPGTFPMGYENKKGRSRPNVTITQPYLIGRFEVTRGEWARVMGALHGQPGPADGDRFPRDGVDYAEATAFCQKLTRLDREAGKLPTGYEYRLPTDAEWEYACRAGTLTATHFGNTLSSTQANFDGGQPFNGAEKGPNLGRTARVGSYPANAWGLHDTYGNLCEWCLDWYHADVAGGVDPVQFLPSPERRIAQRVIRGGCHSRPGRYCRSANRFFEPPENGSGIVGFRVVLTKLHLDGLHALSDTRHTEFDQAWTRDGTNSRIWNKRNFKVAGYHVMSGNIDHIPGEKFAVGISDKNHHTWAHTCLADGRILVQSDPPNQALGYYLMTPGKNGTPGFKRIQCDLATKGVLDRISLSPSETRVCFEFQAGFDKGAPGRTLYVADFDAKQRSITNARAFANEGGEPVWYAYPRWSADESAIIYQADGKVHIHDLANGSTRVVAAHDLPVKRAPK